MNLIKKREMLLAKQKAELEELDAKIALLKVFPDIIERKNRWGKLFLCSDNAIREVDSVEFGHSCGCCSDASLLAYFLKEVVVLKYIQTLIALESVNKILLVSGNTLIRIGEKRFETITSTNKF